MSTFVINHFPRLVAECADKATSRGQNAKILYLGRNEKAAFTDYMGNFAMNRIAEDAMYGTKRPQFRGMEIVWVDEDSYMAVGDA